MEQHIKAHVIAEISVAYNPLVERIDCPVINSATQAYNVLIDRWNVNTLHLIEEFKIMLLNRGNRLLGIFTVSSGGITGTVADPRIIFAVALKCAATSIILAHNHPSGTLKPSTADEGITKKLTDAGRLLDIVVTDHIIISFDSFFSFAEEGIL